MTDFPSSTGSGGLLPWPSREVVAREIRRAMLDNPTDESFNKREEKREIIANIAASAILERFARSIPPAQGSPDRGEEATYDRANNVPVAWIAFAGNGNIRLWTSDAGRAKEEKAGGLDLRAFTLAELVALVGRIPVQPTQGGDKGEAVAWRWRHPAWDHGKWHYRTDYPVEPDPNLIGEPLYAAPQPASNALSEILKHVRAPNRPISERLDRIEEICTAGEAGAAAYTSREKALEAAALEFVAKVDRGEARSRKSYAAFKAALAIPSTTPGGDGRSTEHSSTDLGSGK